MAYRVELCRYDADMTPIADDDRHEHYATSSEAFRAGEARAARYATRHGGNVLLQIVDAMNGNLAVAVVVHPGHGDVAAAA